MAALLSIPFSPIFGSIIHAMNWRRLGLPRRAAIAWLWAALIFLAFLAVSIFGAQAPLSESTLDGYFRLTQLLSLVLWYFAAARAQGKYIMGTLGSNYLRESWVTPVCAAVILVGALYGLGEYLY